MIVASTAFVRARSDISNVKGAQWVHLLHENSGCECDVNCKKMEGTGRLRQRLQDYQVITAF